MTATFDRWEWSARSALADRGIGYHDATPLIEDARAHHRQSGRDPDEVLGTPQEFAADVAAARPAVQARLDTQGRTPRDHLSDAAFVVAFLGVPATLTAVWVTGGLTIPVTAAGLAGVALLAVAMIVGYAAPGALRAAGHPRLAPWGFVASAVLGLASAVAFTQLPRHRLAEIPALGVLAVSLGLCWLLTRPARPTTREYPAPDDADPDDPGDPQAWFARLRDLLVGRFDVPAERAAVLVAETRAHVAATGAVPREEFPSVAGYARELAESEAVRQGPWWRSPTARLLARAAIPVLLLPAVVDYFLQGRLWMAAAGSAVLLWMAWEPVREALAILRRRRAG